MSVNLMSAIFETEFRDLTDGDGNITKASTAKLVLLAMADHANDEGEGAYPSIERLCRKTALSPQTIRNTFDALRYNGVITLEGASKYGTNNHTINTKSFPKAIGKEVTVLTLYPLDPLMSNVTPSNQSPETLYPLDPNHHITIKESSSAKEISFDTDQADIAWTLKAGKAVTPKQIYKQKEAKEFEDMLEAQFRRFPLNWSAFDEKAKENFRRYIRALPAGQSLPAFVDWWMSDEKRVAVPPYTLAIVMQRFPQAFTQRKNVSSNTRTAERL